MKERYFQLGLFVGVLTLLITSLLVAPIHLTTSPYSGKFTYRGNQSTLGDTTAQATSTRATYDTLATTTSSNDDSDDMEVGVEWINTDYGGGDIYTDESAEGFYNTLGEEGWTKSFNYGDDLAWESDFEKSSVGGSDSSFVDDVDFAYFAGHGNKGLIDFSTDYDGDGNHPSEVYYSETKWGDKDLEWMTLVSCLTLHPDYKEEWIAHACAGSHLHALLGFKNKVAVKDARNLGTTFAKKLTDGKGIKDAWKTATKEECDSVYDTEAAIIYPKVYYDIYLYHNYAQETLPNEGNYIGTDPSYYVGRTGYSVDYYYESWVCG